MADDDNKKLKLTLKKTDSSRIKTDTNRLKKPRTGADADTDEPTLAVSAPEGSRSASETSSISDPMAMRDTDTSKLKRLQLTDQADGRPADANSETVTLKVIREQKKPSSGRTVRLMPGTDVTLDDGTPTKQLAKSTLKLKMPGPGGTDPAQAEPTEARSAATLRITPPSEAETKAPAGVPPATPETTALSRPTIKPKAGGTLKLKPIPASASSAKDEMADSGEQTLALPPADAAAPDASHDVQAQEGGTARLTLKVTPRKTETSETVRLPGVDPNNAANNVDESAKKTVQISAEDAPKKTLRLSSAAKTHEDATVAAQPAPEADEAGGGKKSFKLRSGGKGPSQPPQAAHEPGLQAMAADSESSGSAGGGTSGIVVVVASVAALLAMGAVVALNLLQFMLHCQ